MVIFNRYKECSHGKGHDPYVSDSAKLKYAESLLRLSDKLFFTPFVPIVGLSFVEQSPIAFTIQLIVTAFCFAEAICIRHEGLKIIDLIENNET